MRPPPGHPGYPGYYPPYPGWPPHPGYPMPPNAPMHPYAPPPYGYPYPMPPHMAPPPGHQAYPPQPYPMPDVQQDLNTGQYVYGLPPPSAALIPLKRSRTRIKTPQDILNRKMRKNAHARRTTSRQGG